MNNKYNESSFTIDCECGCIKLVLDNWEDSVTFSAYRTMFQSESEGFFDKVWKRTKSIWYAVIGKDYYLYEIVLYPESFEKFKQFINNSKIE